MGSAQSLMSADLLSLENQKQARVPMGKLLPKKGQRREKGGPGLCMPDLSCHGSKWPGALEDKVFLYRNREAWKWKTWK